MKSQIHWNQDLLIFLLLFCFDSKTWFQWDSGFFLTATYPSCNDGLATSHNSMMPGTWHLQNKYEPFPQSSQLWLFTLRFPRLVLSTESLKNSLAAELIIWLVQLFLEKKKKVCEKNWNKLQRCISTNTSFAVDDLELYLWIWVVLVNIQKVKTFASTMRLKNCFLPLATVDELLASQSQSLHVISLYIFPWNL